MSRTARECEALEAEVARLTALFRAFAEAATAEREACHKSYLTLLERYARLEQEAERLRGRLAAKEVA